MIYIKMDLKNNLPLAFQFQSPERLPGKLHWHENELTEVWQSRWDWKSLDEVNSIAKYLTAIAGSVFVGVDSGQNTYPRFDIVEAPKRGDPVSYCFNGDCYPDGYIFKVTKTLQVITDTGSRYLRRRETGNWMRTGGTWSLVHGHISKQNPEF